MAHGIIHDLAVGAHPGGADAWALPGLLVQDFSVGAPPDGFNQLGQDWTQPPWNPRLLAADRYAPMAELFAASLRHGGGLRVDHVMGLMRLWWIPSGQPPERGAYVRYDHEASVGALAGAAARAGAVAIGEDLGTVEPWIRDYLASNGILGTMMLWFTEGGDGAPLPPAEWRRACMATVGTHDVPPVSGFVTGDQVTVRARLGLLTTSTERERAESAAKVARWQAALVAEGLLPPDRQPDAGAVHHRAVRLPEQDPQPVARRLPRRCRRRACGLRTSPARVPSIRTGRSRSATSRGAPCCWSSCPASGCCAGSALRSGATELASRHVSQPAGSLSRAEIRPCR